MEGESLITWNEYITPTQGQTNEAGGGARGNLNYQTMFGGEAPL